MGIESPVHLLFIALIALIVLGPKRLPGIARAIGQGIREFRGALEQAQEEDPEPPEAPAPTAQPETPAPTAQPETPAPTAQAETPAPTAQAEAPEPTAHAQAPAPTAPAQAPPVPAEHAHEPPADALASASSEVPEPTIPLEDSPPR